MLLSRVAESVYWAGRYLERAEATARLVHVHTELFLDLPKAAGVNWAPLLAVTGSGQTFHDRHTRASEEEVVEFLATGSENHGLDRLVHRPVPRQPPGDAGDPAQRSVGGAAPAPFVGGAHP